MRLFSNTVCVMGSVTPPTPPPPLCHHKRNINGTCNKQLHYNYFHQFETFKMIHACKHRIYRRVQLGNFFNPNPPIHLGYDETPQHPPYSPHTHTYTHTHTHTHIHTHTWCTPLFNPLVAHLNS